MLKIILARPCARLVRAVRASRAAAVASLHLFVKRRFLKLSILLFLMLLLIALVCSLDHTGGAAIGGEFGSSYVFLGARIYGNDIP